MEWKVSGGDEISIGDALEILKYLAGLDNVIDDDDNALAAAIIVDAGESTAPTIGDALEILKYLAGLENMIAKS